jgi:hypothetical protein
MTMGGLVKELERYELGSEGAAIIHLLKGYSKTRNKVIHKLCSSSSNITDVKTEALGATKQGEKALELIEKLNEAIIDS